MYKVVCRNQEGEEIFTVQEYNTEWEAQAMAMILNHDKESPNRWTVEPLYYH
jgi:hypothetical protein